MGHKLGDLLPKINQNAAQEEWATNCALALKIKKLIQNFDKNNLVPWAMAFVFNYRFCQT